MTEVTIPVPDVRKLSRRLWAVLGVVMSVLPAGAKILRTKSRPAVSQIAEHAYSIIGFGFVDLAFFHFGMFWGPLATGVSFILFEWKVSEE